MKPPYLSALKAAHKAIELVSSELAIYKRPVAYFEPTDLGSLPGEVPASEASSRQIIEFSNRLRSAKYICLVSAGEVVNTGMTLMQEDLDLFDPNHSVLLQSLASDLQRNAESMMEAAEILLGIKPPPTDHSVDVSRMRSSQIDPLDRFE